LPRAATPPPADVGLRPDDDDGSADFRPKRRPRCVIALLAEKHEIRGREVLLADLDAEPLDSLIGVS